MLGPTREKLLTSQRESLQDNDFGLDNQEANLQASIDQINFMGINQDLPPILENRVAELQNKVAAIQQRRQNIQASIQTVTDELGRTLRIRDAQSFTIQIPEDEEERQRLLFVPDADHPEFFFQDPDLEFAHKFLRSFVDPKGNVNFRAFFNKLFDYGKLNGFSHQNYMQVIGTLLSGAHYDSYITIKEKGLQAVTDFFMSSAENLNDPLIARSQCKHFMRREDEGIRRCMFRYDLLLSKAAILFPNNNHDLERLKVLERSVGPKTLMAIDHLENTQVGILNTAPSYEEILRVAERQEISSGEFVNGIFNAFVLLPTPVVHSVDVQGDDKMMGKALKRSNSLHDKVQAIRQARKDNPENRFYGRETKQRGNKYYRSNSGSRESSRERNERSNQYPATLERSNDYDERLRQASLQLAQQQSQQQAQQPPPQQPPQTMHQPVHQQPQRHIQLPPQQQEHRRPIIPTQEFNAYSSENSSNYSSRSPSPSGGNLPAYREPTLMPASMDYNARRSGSQNYNTYNQGSRRDSRADQFQRSRSTPYNGQSRQGQGYYDQGRRNAYSSGNYRGRQYNRADTPVNRQNNAYPQQGGYRQGSRSPSPAQGGGYYSGQAGQYGLNRPSSYSMSPSRFWKMPGTHIPPHFDFKAQPNHCTKCGGQKAHNGDVIFESGHNDMECRKYVLYNEKGCMICNALGIKSFHYESECRRNAGFAATMIRPLN